MATIEKKTKKLVISLIKDDLIHTKLLHGLRALDIYPDAYTLHLSETIFELMDLTDSLENDAVFDHYFKLSERVRFIDLQNPNALEKLAGDLYEYLDLQNNEY